MNTLTKTSTDWIKLSHELGQKFAQRAAYHDEQSQFVSENYAELKSHGYFSAMIPTELGGSGVSFEKMADIIRILAHYCGSTSLAFSMHQHLVAASIWKYKHKGIGGQLLQDVANHQLVLVSTGARDWLRSNGEMIKVEGGYLLSAKKHFASQSAEGDIAITSAPFLNEQDEWRVLHFGVPFSKEGVSVTNDWDVLGMRGTGSQTIIFDKVFIPEESIALDRARDPFHPAYNLVLAVAMPLIMSTYVGLSEQAMDIAISIGKRYAKQQAHLPYIIGKMNNTLTAAKSQRNAMVALNNNFDFDLSEGMSIDILSLKSNVSTACMQTVQEAMEAIGGQSFYKKNELERIFRDVQAAQFHPLPQWEQYQFTGERILNQ
ncbi:acyl-CoA dehydrogenase family protein [Echinicola sp. 20G]|uniref:acyl-CoA dehydrogenase family protein n=1 Tax=Echinicola sp. 20G TaxID=2781961 RepID=UPI001910968D|nr:acyl-CoA dehydrogenase family protein [Echinicola sp. 20G]